MATPESTNPPVQVKFSGERPVPGASRYKVSAEGFVWSNNLRGTRGKRTTEWHRLTGRKTKSGHLYVTIRYDSGKPRSHSIHRLVLEAFVGPCPDGMECLHYDGDPSNNHIDNLRWGTRSENIEDSRRHGTLPIGENHRSSKLKWADITPIREALASGMSQRQVGKMFGVHSSIISDVINGKRWRNETFGKIVVTRRPSTAVFGERHGNSKLKWADIPRIRDLLAKGMTNRAIAEEFHVSEGTISAVARGERWRNQ